MRLRWDQGTVRLDEVGEGAAVEGLPGVLWDERTGVHRAPAHRAGELARAARAAGLDLIDEVLAPGRRPAAPPPPELRPYQAAAVGVWRTACRGIVALPTGAGKTRTAIACICALAVPTLVLVPPRVLLGQWLTALREHGFAGSELARHGDGVRDLGPITVATFASARLHMAALGNRFGLLVVDECHWFAGGGRDEALEMCAAPARLGLSATPPAEGARLEQLAALIGPVCFRSSVDELAGSYLSRYRLVTVHLSLTDAERAEHDEAMARFRPMCRAFFQVSPAATWPMFVAAASRSEAGRRALRAHRRAREVVTHAEAKRAAVAELLARHRTERLLVFTADNAAAWRVARDLLVMPITCEIAQAERASALSRFAAGELTALVSARVLNEGVDVPAAEVAVIMSGSHGSREYVQRIGRVLRPREGKEAVVYDLVVPGTHEVAQLARGRERLGGR